MNRRGDLNWKDASKANVAPLQGATWRVTFPGVARLRRLPRALECHACGVKIDAAWCPRVARLRRLPRALECHACGVKTRLALRFL